MTCDDLLGGRLRLRQPDDGPRVNMDTVLLASWVRRVRGGCYVELGSAAGAVSLMLAMRLPVRLLGLEIREELVALARLNAEENGLSDRVSFVCADVRNVRECFAAGVFDGLAVNPPYGKVGRWRASASGARTIARRDDLCSLSDVTAAASWLLRDGGRFFAVYRADGAAEFLSGMRAARVEPKRMRFVHPRPGAGAILLLAEGRKGGGEGVEVEPPMFVRDAAGNHTPDLLAAYDAIRRPSA
ncbi:MAG: methyltransferase domain-containing protein [Synergistaceae bacterium]|jgi:tRNA1(Val) A37 N6-methylase TrmN6|nr:methyltransferase domain-containing protein [Synergistaceae bacterium]